MSDYQLYRAEAQACGYEVLSEIDWIDPDLAKVEAYARYVELEENDELDLY